MKNLFPTELAYQISSLLVAFILVHAVYVAVIRPNADAFIVEEQARIQLDPNQQPQRSYYVVLRDFEQEVCFILMFWALAILGYKAVATQRQQKQLELDLVGLPEGTHVTVESAEQASALIRKRIPEKAQEYLLARVMLSAIDRFSATRSVQDASSVVHAVCESEAERAESELSIIRYIAWAIPSVGFIGTVRGIGDALGQAHRAVEGDITGVTQSLGVAFNSTFIALLVSIVLMFLIHGLQTMQERLVLDVRRYCDDWFVRRLRV
jgi:biopolymer transport protein ExbB/TolQ